MARPSWIDQIRHATNAGEQVVALRALKNDLVGHPLKKEMAVGMGVLDPIVHLSTNRQTSRTESKTHDHTFKHRPLAEWEMVRLQGLQVLASIALGGPSFLAPLQSAMAFTAILSNLCPARNPPQLVMASLRALLNLAESAGLASGGQSVDIGTIAEALFVRQHIKSLHRILLQASPSIIAQCQISGASSLISKLCREDRHQQALANSGVLDALATRFAAFVVADGLVIPGAEALAQKDGLEEYLPRPAPSNAKFSSILEAIAVIITESKFRASQFLYSPSILAVLPSSQSTDFVVNQNTRAAWNAFNAAGLSARQNQLNAVDFLLPCIPYHNGRGFIGQGSSAFPPLGSSGSRDNLAQLGRKFHVNSAWTDSQALESPLGANESPPAEPEDPESPLIAYLTILVRLRAGMERLMAISILTTLYRAGLTHKSRETTISLLVVPLLVHMLDDIVLPPKGKDGQAEAEAMALDNAIKERAPAILAMLITDSENLQNAAFNANLVSKLSKMLKVSYDPVPESDLLQRWSPREDEGSENTSRLGDQGQPPLLNHKIKVRESTLKAIAALVPFKDEYRKAIVDQGMIPHIVESMNPNPRKPVPKTSDRTETANKAPKEEEEGKMQYGTNPIPVLIAACGAVRALSRSVTILRTTLIDNGVAMPVFNLLQHPDIEVQIAATATVCNLVTDVSPMREEITGAGVLKVLCEHAHSTNAKLRLNAVWALKHFVHAVSNDMKRQCLEELGQGWLVQLICNDTEDEALVNSKGAEEMPASQSNGEGVDEDVDMDDDQGGSALGAGYARPSSQHGTARSKLMQQAETRLALLREAETNPARKARKDDIAVQEQGLDFIRNLIGGASPGGTAETTEMIDFLFNALGQDRVFEILASKLRPKVVNPFGRRGSAAETRVIPPQSEIITAVSYILVHMAASVPRHRQLVIAQTDLLKLLVQQFGHPSIEVRLALCYLVTNLTWRDDSNDSQACAQRANELKKLRFLSKLELLEHDPELNVRQLAKSALWQMKQSY